MTDDKQHESTALQVALDINPDSPDETASGQLCEPFQLAVSSSYDGSGGGCLTDPTGERRNRQFAQRFCGLRPYPPNLSGESGLTFQSAAAFDHPAMGQTRP